jgi:hypothetical protein
MSQSLREGAKETKKSASRRPNTDANIWKQELPNKMLEAWQLDRHGTLLQGTSSSYVVNVTDVRL